ncbi:barstar family protein [Streptomyces sp. I05A-00742]|uniref:barstar family protein n=1 Tax=Streptomyces sp. I05A-00742 TaxID=2732853 RepID=UPI001488B2EC|nr:barstar family protein [Streptomyces sp. I05A-00742]
MTGTTRQLPDPGVPGLLDGTVPPGIYRLPVTESPSHAAALATGTGWRAARLRLRDVDDKASFLDRCAADLGFPGWFGHNWDALADCLTDLSWWRKDGEPRGYLLLAEDWDAFHKAAPDTAATAWTILDDAVGFWRDRENPMAVLLA